VYRGATPGSARYTTVVVPAGHEGTGRIEVDVGGGDDVVVPVTPETPDTPVAPPADAAVPLVVDVERGEGSPPPPARDDDPHAASTAAPTARAASAAVARRRVAGDERRSMGRILHRMPDGTDTTA
jgi:hypothetical protein